jgi:hypothetical protein
MPVKFIINKTPIQKPKILRYFSFILDKTLPIGLARKNNMQIDVHAEITIVKAKTAVCEN